jgi:hypothetical protein
VLTGERPEPGDLLLPGGHLTQADAEPAGPSRHGG